MPDAFTPAAAPFVVAGHASVGEFDPQVTYLSGGRFVVVWETGNESIGEIMAQIYDADGATIGTAFVVNQSVAGKQTLPAVTALSSGGFLVAWADRGAGKSVAQAFDADGGRVGAEILVTNGGVQALEVTAAPAGGFQISWEVFRDGIRSQYYDSAAQPVGAQFTLLSSDQTHIPSNPAVLRLAGGGLVVAYWEEDQDGFVNPEMPFTIPFLKLRVYDSGGNLLTSHGWGEWTDQPDLAPLAGGGFVLVWNDHGGGIIVQRFDEGGNKIGDEIHILEGNHASPAVIGLPSGGFVVSWDDSSVPGGGDTREIRAQLFDGDGHAVGGAFFVNTPHSGSEFDSELALLPDGQLVFAWAVLNAPGSSSWDVMARRFLPVDPDDHPVITGTEGDDDMNGGPAGETIYGLGGNDVIRGNGGSNIVHGGDGDDLLFGGGSGTGSDTLDGGAGDDTIIVTQFDSVIEAIGGGHDNVLALTDFTLDAGAEVEILSTGNHSAGGAIDLTGNEFGQIIIGNPSANTLIGGGGADFLQGLGGNDLYYVDADDRVIEVANAGYDNVVAAQSYFINAGAAVEIISTTNHNGTAAINLGGNEFGQVIIGNHGQNYLFGGGGSDLLEGRGGDDFLYVDANDPILELAGGGYDNALASESYTLNGGAHVEVLSTTSHGGTAAIDLTGNEIGQLIIGNAAGNVLRGGGGADTLIGLAGGDTLFVDADDSVREDAGGGHDNVLASATYALTAGAHVEILSTTNHGGTAAIGLAGNELGQVVIGNAGANLLDGGLGGDALQGLGGADTFAFTTALGGTNVDFILDFVGGTDRIALENGVFTGLAEGALPPGAFVTGTAAADADDRIIYDGATGRLYFDADGNGAGAMVQFATLQGSPALVAGDFTMI